MKRICASCGTKFYDFSKLPVICPSCGAEFTGEVQVKSRRSRSTIAPDTVKRDEVEAKNKKAAITEEDDDDTISLDDLDEGDNDSDDTIDDDLDIDDIEDSDDDNDDDLSDLDGDIKVNVDDDDR
jgi:uncharacterized protein (TIGR02300 family)